MGRAKMRPLYDSLTGLPKLSLLKNLLNDYVLQSSDREFAGVDRSALVYLDIDNFKYLNETYGRKAGSDVIKCVAEYLVSKAKNSNFVSRVAKDKFAILFTDINSNAELYETIDEIINSGCNICSSKYVFYITMSAGVALYPEHGKDIASLMKKAETAIYSARKTGKEINIYSDELQNNIIGQMLMVNELQLGIEKEEFTLFYQPEYNLNTNEIIGVEALVRWPHPEKGFISPEIFIPIAEKSKQIYELERWIINKALQQKQLWEEDGLDHIELSINLSSKTLESESNFQKIEKIISSYHVDYSKIIFEITETVLISQVDLAIERINRLRRYGIRIALDDFGTGFSSLTHIMKLPIDIIKIDRSFIKAIPNGNEETIITQNILSLARDLNYRVVAEGIETQDQLEFLKEMSCERGQGYLLCKPLPSDKLCDVLRQKMIVLC
jgi:diguanylate cyclase (GGDEF)-like protein